MSRRTFNILASSVMAVILLITALGSEACYKSQSGEPSTESSEKMEAVVPEATEVETETQEDTGFVKVGDMTFVSGYEAVATDNTATPSEDAVASEYAILINASNGEIVASKNAKVIMNPASMTKVLTILTAADHVKSLDDVVTIEFSETDFCFNNDCSNAGLETGDQLTVRDLFYGTILPSGADAALALSRYAAGSYEAFVDMMNAKVEELGLSETAHFTNCIGIYDENLKCTVYDMAMIMKAALENDICREVLAAHTYTIPPSENHPEGIVLSNWFLRRIEDHIENNGVVMGAKTGFVAQSGSCAVSYEISETGVPYICATGKSYSSWGCIYDHVAMYKMYAK